MAVLLGIDYGLARIGLAISRVGLAEPLLVIDNDLDPEQKQAVIGPQAWQQLLAVIKHEAVEQIVLGVSEQHMAELSLALAALLRKAQPVPVATADETLSSVEAKAKLQDLPAHKRQGPIDHYAAAIILENYLEVC